MSSPLPPSVPPRTPPRTAPLAQRAPADASRTGSTGSTGKVKERQRQTGQKTPPAAAPAGKAALFASIPQLAESPLDQQAVVKLLQKLMVEGFEFQLQGEQEITKAHEAKLKDMHKNNIHKLKKALKKKHHHNKWAKVGKILGWVAAGLGIVVGIVLLVVTIGTGSPVAAILIAVSLSLAVAMIALEASGEMDKISDALAKEIAKGLIEAGVDPSKARMISKIIAMVTIAVIVMTIQIALTVMSGGANTAELTSQVAKMAVKIATISAKVAVLTAAAAEAGSAAADTASAVYQYQATGYQADMIDNQAIIQKLRAMLEGEEKMMKEIVDVLLGVKTAMANMIKDENENRSKLADTNPRAVA